MDDRYFEFLSTCFLYLFSMLYAIIEDQRMISWWPWPDKKIRVFLDHTGIHSGGLALDRRARGVADVAGLLQLGILLVFADEIHWTAVGSEPVIRTSANIAERLQNIGAHRDVFKISEDLNEYNSSAAETAAAVADDLEFGFELVELEDRAIAPTKLDRNPSEENPRWLQAALAPEGSVDYGALELDFAQEIATSVTGLMVVQSAKLRDSIRRVHAEHNKWSGVHSSQLDAFLRYSRNDMHAHHRKATYVPAVNRAILVRDRNRFLTENVVAQISKQVDEIVGQLRGTPIAMPALAAALVQRSFGEPEGVIKYALELREKAYPLRKLLRTDWSQIESTLSARRKRTHQMIELRHQLATALGLQLPAKLSSAADWNMSPIPTINAEKVSRFFTERWRSRKFSVLTEVSNTTIYDYQESNNYGKLLKTARALTV
jgi:hypothetical protein